MSENTITIGQSGGISHVVQYGDTQEELMSLLRQGYNLRYNLDNPPEQGKLTLSQPNPETDGVMGTIVFWELKRSLTSDQLPDDLADYFDLLYPPGYDGPRVSANTYSAPARAFMQDFLTAYKALLREEEELNPPTQTSNTNDTTQTDSDPKNTTITLPTGHVVKLSYDILLTHSLSDEQLDLSQPYLYRISDYINPETGRLEDLPIPLIVFKNDDSADTTVTDTTDTVNVQNADPGLYGPGNVTVHFNSDYPEPVPTKLIALVVFPELPLDEIPTDIAEYFAKFFPNQSLTETYSDEQIAQLQGALDSFIASRKVQEAKDTTDPSYNLEYNAVPADTTVTDSTALIAGLKSYLEEIAPKMSDIDSLTDEEVASFNETLKSYKEALRQAGVATCLADTTLDPRTDTGMNLETLDPRTDTSLTALLDSYIAALDEKEATTTDTTVTDTTNNVTAQNAAPVPFGPQPTIVFDPDPEYAKQMEEQLNVKFRQAGYGRGQAFFRFIYDSDEAITPSGYELVRTESWSGPDCTDEQIADIARYIIQNDFFYDEQQKALMLEAVDAFLANPKKAQSIFDLTFTSTMDAETEAVQSVQVACAEDGGWRTIGTLNNPDGIDWKYQAGNLTGSGTASVVWHAQELGALGVWTDGTDNWTAVDGWFDANWTMLGCGDFDGDGKDSVLMSLNGGLFYSVDLDGTLTSLGGLNWSGWEFGAVGDFAGDGKDDVVLFHKELGCVVLLADGNADSFERLGQLDASDWSIAGAGDLDGDGKDDLLVRQTSTGLAGAYASADMSKWSTVSSDYLLA